MEHLECYFRCVGELLCPVAASNLLRSDTLENLTKLYEGRNYVDLIARGDEDKIRRIIESIPGADSVELDAGDLGRVHARIAMQKEVDIREDLFFRFADAKIPILSMEFEEVTLEKVFLELTGDHFEPTVSEPEPSDDEVRMTAEEIFAAQAVQNAKMQAEESVEEEPAPAPAAEKTDKHAKPAKNGDDDDYKPLFGGN